MSGNFLTCEDLKFTVKEFLNDPTSSISVYEKIYISRFLLEKSIVFMRENVSASNGLKFIVKVFLNDPTSSIYVYEKIYNSKPLPNR